MKSYSKSLWLFLTLSSIYSCLAFWAITALYRNQDSCTLKIINNHLRIIHFLETHPWVAPTLFSLVICIVSIAIITLIRVFSFKDNYNPIIAGRNKFPWED